MEFKNRVLTFLLTISWFTSHSQGQAELEFRGALRFNNIISSWKEGQQSQLIDFMYDMFLINTRAAYQGVKRNEEYSLYSATLGGFMVNQGLIDYHFNYTKNLQIGLTQVPIGITQYNANNWFFNRTYYLGLEDDYEMDIICLN